MTAPYEPTPEEIRAACEEIRLTWPEAKLRRCEFYQELDDVPRVHRPTDHMVRREQRGRE